MDGIYGRFMSFFVYLSRDSLYTLHGRRFKNENKSRFSRFHQKMWRISGISRNPLPPKFVVFSPKIPFTQAPNWFPIFRHLHHSDSSMDAIWYIVYMIEVMRVPEDTS